MTDDHIGALLVEPNRQLSLHPCQEFLLWSVLVLVRQEVGIDGVAGHYIHGASEHPRQTALERALDNRQAVQNTKLLRH